MKMLLHMTGSGLYGHLRFEREAKRLGVQRAIQFYLLKTVKFGDPVLLAEHVTNPAEYLGIPIRPKKKDENIAVGYGYFRVEGVVESLPAEIREKMVSKLHVVSEVGASGLETRACGSYVMAGGYVITDSIEDIVGYIEDACKEADVNPNGFKYFIRGSFVKLDDPVIIHNQGFFRGYKRVDLPKFEFGRLPKNAKKVLNVYDYKRQFYLTKKERNAMDTTLLDEFEKGGESK